MTSKPEDRHQPLSQSQLLLWTGQELNPEAPLYNMVLTFEINGALDPDRFNQAFETLVDQCDAMRTVFYVVDGAPVQEVLKKIRPGLMIKDWTERTETEKIVKDWIEKQSRQIFDLSDKCFQSALIKLAEDHFIWYLNQHHLITDAWGVSVQYKALLEYYRALQNKDNKQFLDLPKFQDYRAYELEVTQTPEYVQAKTYWDQKAHNAPPAPRLYGYSHQVLTTSSARVTLDLGIDRSKRLRDLTSEPDLRAWTEHLSLFNIFSTLLFSYLNRVSGQQRLALGTPAHHRPNNVFKETPGMFIELYPLLVEVNEAESFSQLHAKIRNEVNMYLRNSVPGTTSAKINRTFHTVLNYIHASFQDFDGMPMQSEWVHPGHCDPRHHMRLQVHDFDSTGNLELHFDFNTQVFDEDLRALAPSHFLTLLDAFLNDRDQPVGKPVIISDQEYQSISSNLSPTRVRDKQAQTILDLFADQVPLNLNQTALISAEQHMTYQSLEAKSNQLAWYLESQGIGLGQRVLLHLNRSIDLIISILGVLKTGAAYVPIDPNYPPERIAYILKQTEASLVLASAYPEASYGDTKYIILEAAWDSINKYQEEPLSTRIDPGGLAYIMFTSGTSGQPKGAMIPHAALWNYVQWAKANYAGGQPLSFPLFTTPAFDLTITSTFLPLITGGKIIIYPETGTGPDLALLQVIEDNLADTIKLTPSHLGLLNKNLIKGSRISKIIVGGEAFKSEQAKDVLALFGQSVEIYNEYGPTEATVGSLVHLVEPADLKHTSIPIGKPIANTKVYLMDSYLNPVPKGVTGEIYLAGDGLAKGYWKQPALTKERFIECPLEPGTIMYRTGDLARMNRQFDLEYQGRGDRQVKIGGIRVELSEIEAILAMHPLVKQAAVVLQQRGTGTPVDLEHCRKCGIPSNYPSIEFDQSGICNICLSFSRYQPQAMQYFKNEKDLKNSIDLATANWQGDYHCLMLLSGGKDSTYALARLVNMGYQVLAFTLDNGYISEQARANIKRVVAALGVDHIFGKTEAMNAIFVDSLNRYSNVCNGCFKTIYTLSTKLAVEKGIPLIITGLSRGQLFETRLTEELFQKQQLDADKIDETVLQARKAYHQTEDAVNRLLDVSVFQSEDVFERVKYLDFYRYCDVGLDQMLAYLDEHLPWVRPSDTGRSTNCLINQVGIHVHRQQKGYSNYAFPYSWDVRMGHKTRKTSLEEVNEEVDEGEVHRIMEEIGYSSLETHRENQFIGAYYVGEEHLTSAELRNFTSKRLPDYMIPSHFRSLPEIALTSNGKIDYKSLPGLVDDRPEMSASLVAPASQIEQILHGIWGEVLQLNDIGIRDHFLHLGGNSLAAIRLISRINEAFHLDLPLNKIFEYPTIEGFGKLVDDTITDLLEKEG